MPESQVDFVTIFTGIFLTIITGKLYDSVTAVPAYLPDLRFSIVKSIKGYSDDQYKTFMSVTDKFVKEHITFDQSFGNTGKKLELKYHTFQ